jgi:hypothetical protein
VRITAASAVPTTLIATALLALPLATAAAAAPAPAPTQTAAARRVATVTLPTGDHVRLDTVRGKQRVEISRAQKTGPGRLLTTQRLGSDVYVIPGVAKPYLGRFLDPKLFDVTASKAHARADGRIPVRLTYTGATPAVPGVTVTSAAGGSAKGYLTPSSAAAFGKALTAQFKADAKAHFPKRSTLFTGVTKIIADVPGSGVVTPHFPMYTLIIKATGSDGKAVPFGFGFLMNVDDARKYGNFILFVDGEARVSVPAGHYTFVGDDFTYDDVTQTGVDRLITANEYSVKGAGQTLTIDYRKATVSPSPLTTPRPSTLSEYGFEWDRTDALGYGGISYGAGAGDGFAFKVAPSGPATIGTLDVLQTWNTVQAGAAPTYTYTLVKATKKIPAVLSTTARAADLATISSKYYSDGPTRNSAFLRFPVYPFQFFVGGLLAGLKTPVKRTEYVGATGRPLWGDTFLANGDSWDDPGFWDGNTLRALPAGNKSSTEWLHGPLGAGIPVQGQSLFGGYCYGCRTAHTLSVALAPALDSTPDHSSEIFAAEDGLPVARFRFYQNGTLVSDQDDWLGGIFDVPSATTTYKAVLDIDRRLTLAQQSTRSNTVLTFKSAAGQGAPLPADWFCDASDTGTGCRVLPLVQAKVSLPTTLSGRLPATKVKVTVRVSRVQNAATGTIASAGLEVRPAGWFWEPVALKATGNGTYTGVIDSTGFDGSDVDVRISGADTAGNSVVQTVLKAYTVAGS